ncbi:MAG: YjjG family noncanonical pyrimidine nucleotidase [Duncaniella sp.]|nr:YjjG family noncanonical pyrimidine nucleotidase [Duncaniella sp.]
MNSKINNNIFEGVTWVWFDLDDTVIDFHANSRAALAALFDRQELISSMFVSEDEWAQRYMSHNLSLWERYTRGEITQEFLRIDRFATPLAPHWKGSRDDLTAYARSLDSLYLDILADGSAMIDGARELIEAVRRSGRHTGILSNGFHDVQHRKLRRNNLTHLIDRVVLSDDIGVNKPDIRIYTHAMAEAGETLPHRHLMIGDNPATDIAGALGAGWKAILLNSSGTLYAPDHALTVGSLRHLLSYFDNPL